MKQFVHEIDTSDVRRALWHNDALRPCRWCSDHEPDDDDDPVGNAYAEAGNAFDWQAGEILPAPD